MSLQHDNLMHSFNNFYKVKKYLISKKIKDIVPGDLVYFTTSSNVFFVVSNVKQTSKRNDISYLGQNSSYAKFIYINNEDELYVSEKKEIM